MHTLPVSIRLLTPAVALAGLLVAGCGGSTDDQVPQTAAPASSDVNTRYGTVAEVSDYLAAIGPHVQHMGTLLSAYEAALALERTPGERQGTGQNLAAKADEVLPGFRQVRDALDEVEPPPSLATFHRDTRKMVTTRIKALVTTTKGWETEQSGGDFEALYRDAEAQYRAANDMVRDLNTEAQRIQQALQEAGNAG